jgi:aldehyde:ferredoxin oxidoreductase
MALVYATSPRGACHNQSDYFFVDWGHIETDLGIEFLPRQDGPEKAANVARHQNWRTVHNALVMCILATVPPQVELDLINAACGYEWTFEDMLRCGERGWNLKRMINLRLGLTADDDRLPKPLLEPYPTGGSAGYMIDFPALIKAYYKARSWDEVTGRPTKEKLLELGLTEIS